MSESIAARVGRIISGTVNRLVDAAENLSPEMVMEEAIREVDRAIDDVRTELGQVIAKKHLATSRLAEANGKHEDIAGKIEVAVKEGRDDLAETAVGQLLDIEAQLPILELAISDARDSEQELEGYVSALRARRREMEQELDQYRAAQSSVSGGGDQGGEASGPGVERAVEKAEATFNRMMARNGGVPAGAGMPADRETAAKLSELDELQRQNRIRERLSAFKAAVKED